VRLADLIETTPTAYSERPIDRVVEDARLAGPGALFVACAGVSRDGHAFVADAAHAGCSAVVGAEALPLGVSRLLHDSDVPYLRVDDPAETLGWLASRLAGDPSRVCEVVGVTGTNGKTTVATLLHQLFSALGQRSGLIATTGILVGEQYRPNSHTTPGAVELHALLAAMRDAGCRYCFLEVTSHAIVQRRIAGVEFRGGIFTTLGHKHLDYHGTLEAYAKVKQRFFDELPVSAFALANADDPRGSFMLAQTRASAVFYGRARGTRLPWSVERCDERGMDVRIGPYRARTSLLGEHNAANLAAALTAAVLLGENADRLIDLVPHLRGARGRMQPVVTEPVLGIVDYAHTPEAVRLALVAARSLRPATSLIAVAGCGGDRDPHKRPSIGAALAAADTAIFTADNPRSEDPHAIVAAMLAGVPPARSRFVHVELDRRRAIELALRLARPGDIVLLLGKGHEQLQQTAGIDHPWDDALELRTALAHVTTPGTRQASAGAGKGVDTTK
jgi:UDP-N-acetylmuramoyl-L-alanyl-D-glutamate--2,6-diaminopimelate ligase